MWLQIRRDVEDVDFPLSYRFFRGGAAVNGRRLASPPARERGERAFVFALAFGLWLAPILALGQAEPQGPGQDSDICRVAAPQDAQAGGPGCPSCCCSALRLASKVPPAAERPFVPGQLAWHELAPAARAF